MPEIIIQKKMYGSVNTYGERLRLFAMFTVAALSALLGEIAVFEYTIPLPTPKVKDEGEKGE